MVELACKLKYFKAVQGVTDKNGYYFIDVKDKLTPSLAKYCKVKLVSSPVKTCNKPTVLNYVGPTGAYLKPEKSFVLYRNPYKLFSVPILAFQSACKY